MQVFELRGLRLQELSLHHSAPLPLMDLVPHSSRRRRGRGSSDLLSWVTGVSWLSWLLIILVGIWPVLDLTGQMMMFSIAASCFPVLLLLLVPKLRRLNILG
jgi:hypothetical protein